LKLLYNIWSRFSVDLAAEELEDRLYLIDASNSMDEKLSDSKPRKIEIVKQGLSAYCRNVWPVSYYDRPIRIGIVAFRLLGTPGDTRFEVIIPLYPSPMSLEMYRLAQLKPKGSCHVEDGLEYARVLMSESERTVRKLYLISDGGFTGHDPLPAARALNTVGVQLKCIELGTVSSKMMQDIASQSSGTYQLVGEAADFENALK
jgi:Mg-chelatase subunit ChlD